ncbi:hypothetical protein EV127DRAFT_413941 [Xylaria flabelliformis]|nr:hypothetical protein EV127DRAFT_413941 [Xylaria flabelliformis]
MSSAPANQPPNQPRTLPGPEGQSFTKADYIEYYASPGEYDDYTLKELTEEIDPEIQEDGFNKNFSIRYFERLRKLHLADGRISNEQNEILKTVMKKLETTWENVRDATFELQELRGRPTGLRNEMKRRAICFLEQLSLQISHEIWIESCAHAHPLNIPAMIQDAQEFPVPLWKPEPAQPTAIETPEHPAPEPLEDPALSSTPPSQPRAYINYDKDYEREELTKAEFLRRGNKVEYEYYSISDLILELEVIVPDLQLQSDLVPHFERFRSRHSANGGISNEQNEILKTVVEKIQGWAETASTVLLSLKSRPAHEPLPTLDDQVKYRTVDFLEQFDILEDHIEWIEHFARVDPQNVTGMIEDAREFPNPPWKPEEGEQDEQDEQDEQTE